MGFVGFFFAFIQAQCAALPAGAMERWEAASCCLAIYTVALSLATTTDCDHTPIC